MKFLIVQDLRFSQLCCWRWSVTGKRSCAIGWVVVGSWCIQNSVKHLANNVHSHPRRL